MKTRLIRIGNSRGVRLPKPLIEEAGLTEEVDLRTRDGTIIIARARRTRAGWAEAARLIHERSEDRMEEPPTSTRFDEEEWEW